VALMPGSHGAVVVVYVNSGDPVAGRGITHEATLLDQGGTGATLERAGRTATRTTS